MDHRDPDNSDRLSISICIATHERDWLLRQTLEAIGCQVRQADEIVISDSSSTSETKQAVAAFQRAHPELPVRYEWTDCKALPWHRWNGFQHSCGDIVFFMDDDITLAPTALHRLEEVYLESYAHYGVANVAGIGFYTFHEDGTDKQRGSSSFMEHWLGIVTQPSASITPGGLGISLAGMPRDTVIEVGRLSGGRMSFRRDVLDEIGLLDHLVDLYLRGLGRSEDIVLSHFAGKLGRLFLITSPEVTHVRDELAVKTAFVTNGFNKGMAETWGRAHTMRWMAVDEAMYRRQWRKVAVLELLRSVWWGILRRPWSIHSWARVMGAVYGFLLGQFRWRRVPPLPGMHVKK